MANLVATTKSIHAKDSPTIREAKQSGTNATINSSKEAIENRCLDEVSSANSQMFFQPRRPTSKLETEYAMRK